MQVTVEHVRVREADEHVHEALPAAQAVDPLPRARRMRERRMMLHDHDRLLRQGPIGEAVLERVGGRIGELASRTCDRLMAVATSTGRKACTPGRSTTLPGSPALPSRKARVADLPIAHPHALGDVYESWLPGTRVMRSGSMPESCSASAKVSNSAGSPISVRSPEMTKCWALVRPRGAKPTRQLLYALVRVQGTTEAKESNAETVLRASPARTRLEHVNVRQMRDARDVGRRVHDSPPCGRDSGGRACLHHARA